MLYQVVKRLLLTCDYLISRYKGSSSQARRLQIIQHAVAGASELIADAQYKPTKLIRANK